MQSQTPKIPMLAELCKAATERSHIEDVERLFKDKGLSLPTELSDAILGSLALTTRERICLCLGIERFPATDVAKLQDVLSDEKAKLETTMGKEVLAAAKIRNLEDMRDMVRHVIAANDLSILNQKLKDETTV